MANNSSYYSIKYRVDGAYMSFQDLMRDHANEIGLIDEALPRFGSGNPDSHRSRP